MWAILAEMISSAPMRFLLVLAIGLGVGMMGGVLILLFDRWEKRGD